MKLYKRIIILSLLNIIILSPFTNSYAEVQSIETDKTLYTKGENIIITGSVEPDDTGLVSIVIRDPNDEFVMLVQAFPDFDNKYEIIINTKTKFQIHGQYNVTGFIFNMTKGAKTDFEFVNSNPLEPIKSIDIQENSIEKKSSEDNNKQETKIKEDPSSQVSKIPGFPDPEKNPMYYVDRYNNEPEYKDWFDRNFHENSIYEIVGISDPNAEIKLDEIQEQSIVKAQTIENQASIVNDNKSNLDESSDIIEKPTQSIASASNENEAANLLLAIGGLGILFGAAYGIKRKTDNNSEQIFQNRSWIKNQLSNLVNYENPKNIIKKRVAKGEISIEEFYSIKDALDDEN